MITWFFLGKGGVGKTTLALAWGLKQAQAGRRTLVLSLDPAHNLRDYTGLVPGDRPTRTLPGLWLQEADLQRRACQVLEHTLQTVQASYRHLQVLNLEGVLDTLRYSPGAEESAYLEVLEEVRQADWDAVALDLPPTGMALRLVHYPFASLLWVQRLLALRQQIRRLEETVARLHGRPVHQDPVFQELLRLFQRYDHLIRWFRSSSVVWAVLRTPEAGARAEAQRILEALEHLKIPGRVEICNRCAAAEGVPDLSRPLRFPEDFLALSRFLPRAPEGSPGTG